MDHLPCYFIQVTDGVGHISSWRLKGDSQSIRSYCFTLFCLYSIASYFISLNVNAGAETEQLFELRGGAFLKLKAPKFSQHTPIIWDDSVGHSQQGPIALLSSAFFPYCMLFLILFMSMLVSNKIILSPISPICSYTVHVLGMRSVPGASGRKLTRKLNRPFKLLVATQI